MKKFIFLVVSLLILNNAFSQDVRLYNLNYSLLEVNPSFAGSNGRFRAQVINRSEGDLINPSNGVAFGSIDGYIKKLHGGVGFSFSDETAANGALKNTMANLIYAPYFRCPESGLTIVPSLQLSYVQKLADANGLGIAPPGGIVIPSSNSQWYQKKNFDASAGLLVSYKRLYAGFTAFHLNQPDVGLGGISRLPVRYSANASYNIFACSNAQVNVKTLYTKQQAYSTLLVGANALFYKHFIVGGGIALDDAWFANLGYRGNLFTVTVGYDQVSSQLSSRYWPSYEVCASFNLRSRENRKTIGNFETW